MDVYCGCSGDKAFISVSVLNLKTLSMMSGYISKFYCMHDHKGYQISLTLMMYDVGLSKRVIAMKWTLMAKWYVYHEYSTMLRDILFTQFAYSSAIALISC